MDNNLQKPGSVTAPTQTTPPPNVASASTGVTPAQPTPQYDWNRYQVPKPQTHRFVETSDTLDNSSAFKTENSAVSGPPQKTSAILEMPSHKRYLSHVMMAFIVVLLFAFGASLAALKNNAAINKSNLALANQASGNDTIQPCA